MVRSRAYVMCIYACLRKRRRARISSAKIRARIMRTDTVMERIQNYGGFQRMQASTNYQRMQELDQWEKDQVWSYLRLGEIFDVEHPDITL